MQAKIHLLQTLTHVLCCTVDISVPLAIALFYGNFLWDRPDTPNNFCRLLFKKPSPLSPNGAKEAMILHLKAEKGGGWSDKYLENVLHQAITIPERIDDMIHNLHNIASASALFFGKNSVLTIGLNSWQHEISSNTTSYESQSTNDPTFISRILTAVDIRVNSWLTKCTTKTERCNVDDKLIDFYELHCSIKTRQFQFNLPPSIRFHVSSSKRCISEDMNARSGTRGGRDNKRNSVGDRSSGDSKSTPAQNPKHNLVGSSATARITAMSSA